MSPLACAVSVLGVWFMLSVFTTTLYLHRSMSHRSVRFCPAIATLMRIQIWMATGQVPLYWVAVHRKHHQFTDVAGDPHSPYLLGLWHVFFLNPFLTNKEGSNPETIAKYSKDIPRGQMDVVLNNSYIGMGLGIVLTMALMAVLTGGLLSGVLWGAGVLLAHMILYIAATSTINAICHMVGARNFTNTATNLKSLSVLTGGESLHNNHHEDPFSPKMSVYRWEIDPVWPFIQFCVWLKLAERMETINEKRGISNYSTLKASSDLS